MGNLIGFPATRRFEGKFCRVITKDPEKKDRITAIEGRIVDFDELCLVVDLKGTLPGVDTTAEIGLPWHIVTGVSLAEKIPSAARTDDEKAAIEKAVKDREVAVEAAKKLVETLTSELAEAKAKVAKASAENAAATVAEILAKRVDELEKRHEAAILDLSRLQASPVPA
jgi:hypothetical protein